MLVAAAALGGGLSSTRADPADATCQVRKDGDAKQGMSGACTFSQRQGYIDIDLRNGETISLSPGNQANDFKDQKGNKVVRTQAGGSEVSSNAKTACTEAINSNYGGNVRDLDVVRSGFSQANSEVIVDAVGVRGSFATGRWKCLVSSDGKMQELSVVPR